VNHKMAALSIGAIPVEVGVYASGLQYLTGGSYSAIRFLLLVSQLHLLYLIIWKCIDATDVCPELIVKFPTTNNKEIEAAWDSQTISTEGAYGIVSWLLTDTICRIRLLHRPKLRI
jgi:hypothetical protein